MSHGNVKNGFGPLGAGHVDFGRIKTLLSTDENDVRDAVRTMCGHRIVPHAARWFEDGELDDIDSVVGGLGTLGVLGMHLDGYGCAGMSAIEYGLACMELEVVDSGIRSMVSV